MLNKRHNLKKPRKLLSAADDTQADSGLSKKFDAIVVGAGPSGSTAAYFMAKEGLAVLLLERGPYPGSKNCGGASIAAEPMHKLFPDFWDELECERIVTNQRYWWMTEDAAISVGISNLKLAAAPYNRFTVKRPKLYKWLAEKAVGAGATLLLGHHVDTVLLEGTQAIGVRISLPQNRSFFADIIVLADGANSLLAEKTGVAPQTSAENLSLFVKETIALSPEVIEERFNLPPNQASIIGLIGYPTAGFNGTASIHTFMNSININVGLRLKSIVQAGLRPHDLLIRIKKHPFIQPLLDGGATLEYGSAMIPEGGYHAIPKIVHPGLMIVGDAASMVNGTHGIHLGMWSGYFAAQAAYAAKTSRDFSTKKLYLYRTLLNESFIMQDFKANAGAAKLEEDIPYMFDLYSRMANETAYHVAKIYTMPKKEKRKFIFKKVIRMQPLKRIVIDAWKIFKVALG